MLPTGRNGNPVQGIDGDDQHQALGQQGLPTRIATTRSTRCFVAAASSPPRPAPLSTFWSRWPTPCKGRA